MSALPAEQPWAMPIVFGSAALLLLGAVALGLFPPFALLLVLVLVVAGSTLVVRARRTSRAGERRNVGPQTLWRQRAEEANP